MVCTILHSRETMKAFLALCVTVPMWTQSIPQGALLSCVQYLEKSTRFSSHPFSVLTSSHSWRDVDSYDALFMTQSRLHALKILLSQVDISLLTLNAPHASMNGVTPLGMAAWLNQPQAVHALLQISAESVSVDGMDSCGATALMCE